MSLSKDRNTPQRSGSFLVLPVASGKKIFAGALVALNSTGYATPGAVATTLTAAGRAEEYVDNSGGSDGDLHVTVRRGVFKYKNSSTDAIDQADVLKDCYIADDETVSATDGSSTQSKAGKVIGVESDGVWVEI